MRLFRIPRGAPIGVDADGRSVALHPEYAKLFDRQAANPSAAVSVTVGASPYTYTAPSDGVLVVRGGTVSALAYVRGSTTVNAGVTAGPIPLRNSDDLTITYTVAPTVTFLPD